MKNKEQFKLNKKRKPTEANTKMTQMLELSDKKFKAAIIKVFQQAITSMLKIPETILSLSKERENIRKKKENLELKNKNSKDKLSISMENTEKDPVTLTQNNGNYLN